MEKKIDIKEAFPIYAYENETLISKEKGCLTVPLRLKLPDVFSLDKEDYYALNNLVFSIIDILGPNSLIHKQDYFFKEKYVPIKENLDGDFLQEANELHFEGREYLRIFSFMYISLVPSNYINQTPAKANSYLTKKKEFFLEQIIPEEFVDTIKIAAFNSKVESVCALINESGLIKAEIMNEEELFSNNGLYEDYFSLTKNKKSNSFTDISFDDNRIYVGGKTAQFFTVENLDQFSVDEIYPFDYHKKFTSEKNKFPIGNLFSLGFKIPNEHIINQYIYIPENEKVFKALRKKSKAFSKFSGNSLDDNNSIYAQQIIDFNREIIENHKEVVFTHLNVLGITDSPSGYNKMCDNVENAFKKIKINVRRNTLDRKNLFFAGVPGNSIGISSDLYMPMPSDMASALTYYEGEYEEGAFTLGGVRLVDRIDGRPLSVSIYKEPEKKGWIFNRGTLVASGSGGGKSFIVNHYFGPEIRGGAEIMIMEDGNSYDKLVDFYGGVILEHNDKEPYTFNPFILDKYDYVENEKGSKLSEGKIISLITLLTLITGDSDSKSVSQNKEIKTSVFLDTIIDYYNYMWSNQLNNFNFNSYFEYIKEHLKNKLVDKKILKHFDVDVFFYLLQVYYKGGVRESLLNVEDSRIGKLSEEKIIYFKLTGIIDNELLFPIFSLMIMDIFNKKLLDEEKRDINKILCLDEAWKVLARPELEDFFNSQSRLARKYGGQPMFISQKVDDFLASETIKNAIVVNSHIKIFLDMKDFEQNFDDIQEMMGLTDKQKMQILTVNKDLPEDRKLREMCITWKDRVKVYGIETSLEEKCLYETNPIQVKKINDIHKKNNLDWKRTAKTYAEK